MTCIRPPELGDTQLLAYLDGEEALGVAAHLNQCAHCREKARRLAHLQDTLTAGLYRISCPPSEELGEYHLELLPREQRSAVAQHVAECPHCTREIALLQDYLAELTPDVALSPVERVQVWVAELVRGVQEVGFPEMAPMAPAYVGIRGEEEGPLLYQAGDCQVAIEFQPDAQQQDRKALLGLLIGADPGALTAHLWQEDRPLTTVPVDELGNFVFPNLAAGSYELILSGPEIEIQIQELQVGAP